MPLPRNHLRRGHRVKPSGVDVPLAARAVGRRLEERVSLRDHTLARPESLAIPCGRDLAILRTGPVRERRSTACTNRSLALRLLSAL